MSADPIKITYHIQFADNQTKDFQVQLDAQTLSLMTDVPNERPEWTQLTTEQCPNCPLNPKEHPSCPIALNLSGVVDFVCRSLSIENVSVRIETAERNYQKDVALQHALSSLVGIYMVTSGCPILDKLRPMVRFHLPFASIEETVYRAMSMYLMAQYFRKQKGQKPDWDLKHLEKIYKDISTVNMSFTERLRKLKIEDAALNALVHLGCFAEFINMTITEQILNKSEGLFQSYFD